MKISVPVFVKAIGIVPLASFFIVACVKPTGEPIQTQDPELKLAQLFTYDGCIIYRFYDKSEYHYFTDCHGKIAGAYRESCGKGCSTLEYEEIETVE